MDTRFDPSTFIDGDTPAMLAEDAMIQLRAATQHPFHGRGVDAIRRLRDRMDDIVGRGGRPRINSDDALLIAAMSDLAIGLLEQLPPLDA